jgi:hypothetical protein
MTASLDLVKSSGGQEEHAAGSAAKGGDAAARQAAQEVGDFVPAIGNPFGPGQTVTSGMRGSMKKNLSELLAARDERVRLNLLCRDDPDLSDGSAVARQIGPEKHYSRDNRRSDEECAAPHGMTAPSSLDRKGHYPPPAVANVNALT